MSSVPEAMETLSQSAGRTENLKVVWQWQLRFKGVPVLRLAIPRMTFLTEIRAAVLKINVHGRSLPHRTASGHRLKENLDVQLDQWQQIFPRVISDSHGCRVSNPQLQLPSFYICPRRPPPTRAYCAQRETVRHSPSQPPTHTPANSCLLLPVLILQTHLEQGTHSSVSLAVSELAHGRRNIRGEVINGWTGGLEIWTVGDQMEEGHFSCCVSSSFLVPWLDCQPEVRGVWVETPERPSGCQLSPFLHCEWVAVSATLWPQSCGCGKTSFERESVWIK